MLFPTLQESAEEEAKAVYAILEGASALSKMAANIEAAIAKTKDGDYVALKRTDLIGIARAQRAAAILIDILAQGIERGDGLHKVMSKKRGTPPKA